MSAYRENILIPIYQYEELQKKAKNNNDKNCDSYEVEHGQMIVNNSSGNVVGDNYICCDEKQENVTKWSTRKKPTKKRFDNFNGGSNKPDDDDSNPKKDNRNEKRFVNSSKKSFSNIPREIGEQSILENNRQNTTSNVSTQVDNIIPTINTSTQPQTVEMRDSSTSTQINIPQRRNIGTQANVQQRNIGIQENLRPTMVSSSMQSENISRPTMVSSSTQSENISKPTISSSTQSEKISKRDASTQQYNNTKNQRIQTNLTKELKDEGTQIDIPRINTDQGIQTNFPRSDIETQTDSKGKTIATQTINNVKPQEENKTPIIKTRNQPSSWLSYLRQANAPDEQIQSSTSDNLGIIQPRAQDITFSPSTYRRRDQPRGWRSYLKWRNEKDDNKSDDEKLKMIRQGISKNKANKPTIYAKDKKSGRLVLQKRIVKPHKKEELLTVEAHKNEKLPKEEKEPTRKRKINDDDRSNFEQQVERRRRISKDKLGIKSNEDRSLIPSHPLAWDKSNTGRISNLRKGGKIKYLPYYYPKLSTEKKLDIQKQKYKIEGMTDYLQKFKKAMEQSKNVQKKRDGRKRKISPTILDDKMKRIKLEPKFQLSKKLIKRMKNRKRKTNSKQQTPSRKRYREKSPPPPPFVKQNKGKIPPKKRKLLQTKDDGGGDDPGYSKTMLKKKKKHPTLRLTKIIPTTEQTPREEQNIEPNVEERRIRRRVKRKKNQDTSRDAKRKK